MPSPPPPEYLSFHDEPFAFSMGVRSLAGLPWLERDGAFAEDMAERQRLLTERHDEVVLALPGTEDAATEALAEIAGAPAVRNAEVRGGAVRDDAVQHDAARDGAVRGGAVRDAAVHPIESAARLVQEDLCLHLPLGPSGEMVLAAAVVCFPLRWDLRSKMGRPVHQIHGPVPEFGRNLGGPVDRFLERLAPGPGVWRANWSVIDNPALFQASGINRVARRQDVTTDNVADRAYLRVERQTLRRFPVHGSVLFTIHTYQCALGALAAEPYGPEVCRRLAGAIRALPPAMARYKSIPSVAEPVLGWLDAVVSAT